MSHSTSKLVCSVLAVACLLASLSGCSPTVRTLVAIEVEAAEPAQGDDIAEGMEVAFAVQRSGRAPTGEYDADLATVASILKVAPNDISFNILNRYDYKTKPVIFFNGYSEVTIYEDGNAIGTFFLAAD